MSLVYLTLGLLVVLLGVVVVNHRRTRAQALLTSEQAIVEAARRGDSVLAIKSYRALHGVGLREAKQRIDELTRSVGRVG